MGSFPHELPGYRHVRRRGAPVVRSGLGRHAENEPGLRIPNMFDAAVDGTFLGSLRPGRGHRPVRPQHAARDGGLAAMECVVVQDLFLNETANYAHVFLPGASFLEKDGTFTNAERRINRVRKAMLPGRLCRLGSHHHAGEGAGLRDELQSSIRDHGRDRPPDRPSGVSYARLEEEGSIQWPCNDAAPTARRSCISAFVRGKGRFMITEFVPTDERTTRASR